MAKWRLALNRRAASIDPEITLVPSAPSALEQTALRLSLGPLGRSGSQLALAEDALMDTCPAAVTLPTVPVTTVRLTRECTNQPSLRHPLPRPPFPNPYLKRITQRDMTLRLSIEKEPSRSLNVQLGYSSLDGWIVGFWLGPFRAPGSFLLAEVLSGS